MSEIQQQQNSRRIQEKIKLMMKQKKMHKLASEKQLSEKPISMYGDKTNARLQQIPYKQKKLLRQEINNKDEQTYNTFSNNRIKSIIDNEDVGTSASFTMKEGSRKLGWKKQKGQPYESNNIKKTPSVQKIDSSTQQQTHKQSTRKLKRPSSVVNKSTRATTSRTSTRRLKPLQMQDQKQMEQKIRQIIPKCFEMGMKLQKYTEENRLNLNQEYQLLVIEELNIIRLINNSRKYYSKEDNQEDQQTKLSNGVEKEIIEILKKRKEKMQIIHKCDRISNQISNLIDARLSALVSSRKNIQ